MLILIKYIEDALLYLFFGLKSYFAKVTVFLHKVLWVRDKHTWDTIKH